ncbi:MATE family efflux transporter [Shimazuella kribbensis]|uniref:MATE family efflux transporter n=1 Tax=Shimazuella kribbensis TaxID=139808 RepID=UPI00041011B0|nr:MATE family efflux transporter [Shimazuella kribbensis]
MNWHLLKDIRHKLWKTFVEKSLGKAALISNGLLVSNKLGLTAVAAVGVSGMILLTFSFLIDSLTNVTNTKVGKTIGEEKEKGITQSQKGIVVVQGFYQVALLSILLSAIAIVFAPQLLSAIGADQATVEQGTPYLRIFGGFYLIEGLRDLAATALQGMEDFKSPLKAGSWMNGLHIALAILAIQFLELGLVGVAWATVISKLAGLMLLIRPLKRQAFQKRIPWKPEWTLLKSMFFLSKDTMIQSILTRVSLVSYGSVTLYISNEAYAAQKIHTDVVQITYVLMNAFIAVMSPKISTLYGERTSMHRELHDILEFQERDGMEDQVRIHELVEKRKKKDQELVSMVNSFLGLTCLFMGILAVLQYVTWEWIADLYTDDPTTIQLSHKVALLALFWLVPFTCYCVMYRGGLGPVEDRKGSRNSMIIATVLWIASLWVVKDWGLDAILISRVLFEILRGSLVAGRFYSKKWTRCPSSICASHS